MNKVNKIIFVDLDGTLIKHQCSPWRSKQDVILPNTITKLKSWLKKGYKLILTTCRPLNKCYYILNEFQSYGIYFNTIITDLPIGCRILINDKKNDEDQKAIAIEVNRNNGINDIEI